MKRANVMQDPHVYLSTAGGKYRVINRGVPISADKDSAADALAVAAGFKLAVSDRMWDGDRCEFVQREAG